MNVYVEIFRALELVACFMLQKKLMNENEILGIFLSIDFLKLLSMYLYLFLPYVLSFKLNCRFKCDTDNDCGDGSDEGEFCGKFFGNIICNFYYYGCFPHVF